MNQRPEYDAVKTGQKLRRCRLACGYTAEQVREYIRIGTVQAVYKWERGACFPSLDDFFALAELYGVKPDELLIRSADERGFCMVKEADREPQHVMAYWIRLENFVHKN